MSLDNNTKIILLNVVVFTLGIYVSVNSFLDWYSEKNIKKFLVPSKSQLIISTGTISFNKPSKSAGGTTSILLDNSKKLTLWCGGPFSSLACYYIKENGNIVDKEKELVGKKATVWWLPEAGYIDKGTIYQLSVGNKTYFTYEQKKEEYLNNFKNGSRKNPYLSVFFVFIFVFLPLKNIIKGVARWQ